MGERDNLAPLLVFPAYEAGLALTGVASAYIAHKLIKEKAQREGISLEESAKGLGVVYYNPPPKEESEERGKGDYKQKKPNVGGKQGAKDTPSWSKGNKPLKDENGKDFATRLMKEKYGDEFELKKATKIQKREYSQLKKYADRSFGE